MNSLFAFVVIYWFTLTFAAKSPLFLSLALPRRFAFSYLPLPLLSPSAHTLAPIVGVFMSNSCFLSAYETLSMGKNQNASLADIHMYL